MFESQNDTTNNRRLIDYCFPCCRLSTESYGLLLLLVSAILGSGQGCFTKLLTSAGGGIPIAELIFFQCSFQWVIVVIGLLYYKGERDDKEEEDRNNNNDNNLNSSSNNDNNNNEDYGGNRIINKTRLIWIPLGGSSRARKIVLLRGFLGICAKILSFYAFATIPLGDAFTLMALSPVFSILLARIFLGERIRSFHIVATICSFLGAAFIAGPTVLSNFQQQSSSTTNATTTTMQKTLGYFSGLLGSCFIAGTIVLVRMGGKVGAHAYQLMFSWSMFGVLFSLAAGAMASIRNTGNNSFDGIADGDDASSQQRLFVLDNSHEHAAAEAVASAAATTRSSSVWHVPSSNMVWWHIFAMCCFGSLSVTLTNDAGRIAPAGLASIMRATAVLWAYIFEILFFHQIPSIRTVLGAVLVLCSPIVIAVQKIQEENNIRMCRKPYRTMFELSHNHNNNSSNNNTDINESTEMDLPLLSMTEQQQQQEHTLPLVTTTMLMEDNNNKAH